MQDREQPSGNSRLLAPERQERLLAIVGSRRAVRLDELAGQLGVSWATVRRDLIELAAAGEVRRVHGGVVAVDRRVVEPVFQAKAAEAAAAKQRIADRAVGLIAPGDTIFLDSGSTVLALGRLLRGRDDLTIVTNSLPVAVELVGRVPHLVVLGGELRALSQAIVGPLTAALLRTLFFDRAFMGTFALSTEGLSTTDPAEAFTKAAVLERAREVVVLADSRKMGSRSFVNAGALHQVDILITDEGVDDRTARTIGRRGVRVIRV